MGQPSLESRVHIYLVDYFRRHAVMGQPSLQSRVHIYLVDYFRRHAALTLAWTL